jgi:hypothetical protein
MVNKKIKGLGDITYGQMNPMETSLGINTFDPNRATATGALQATNLNQFVPNIIQGKRRWNAIILRSTKQKRPWVASNFQITMVAMDRVVQDEELYYTYKIFIAELDGFKKLPETFARGTGGGSSDSESLINIARDAVAPLGKNWGPLDYGTPVEVIFEDQERGTLATIVQVHDHKRVPLQGGDTSRNMFKTKARTPGNVGSSSGHRARRRDDAGDSDPTPDSFEDASADHGPPLHSKGLEIGYNDLEKLVPHFEPLLEAIRKVESGRRQYDAGNRKTGEGTNDPYESISMSKTVFDHNNTRALAARTEGLEETIAQVQSKQQESSGYVLSATGRYQIIRSTLKKIVKIVAVDYEGGETAIKKKSYNKKNQDILAVGLMMWKQGRAGMYFAGQHDDAEAAAQSLAYEWAAIPLQYDEKFGNLELERGDSRWDGVGGNKSNASIIDSIVDATRAVRTNLDNDEVAQEIFARILGLTG